MAGRSMRSLTGAALLGCVTVTCLVAAAISVQANAGAPAILGGKQVDWSKKMKQFKANAKQDVRDGHDAEVLVHDMMSGKSNEPLGYAERHLDASNMAVKPGSNRRSLGDLSLSLRSYAQALSREDARMGSKVLDVHGVAHKHSSGGDGYIAFVQHAPHAARVHSRPRHQASAPKMHHQQERRAGGGGGRGGEQRMRHHARRVRHARRVIFPAFADNTPLKTKPFQAMGNINLLVASF
ncbi:hypothetical protein T484DRAFT_1906848 [Baffinella frigidus]|nr:hypothetical protein T484DRAFT_1906848 [Cryptophyta sp. CCMP2293]